MMKNKIEYQVVLFPSKELYQPEIVRYGEEGWKIQAFVPMDDNTSIYRAIMYREVPDDSLNANIRNKLGPFQTLIDLMDGIIDFKGAFNINDEVEKILRDAVNESKKSMEYLKHVGE